MISPWGCLLASAFLNQAFSIYILPYPNPKPSGESDEKELPGGGAMNPKEFVKINSVWGFYEQSRNANPQRGHDSYQGTPLLIQDWLRKK